jgi:hypothetical protein
LVLLSLNEYYNVSMFTSLKQKLILNILIWGYYLVRNLFFYGKQLLNALTEREFLEGRIQIELLHQIPYVITIQ